jgi:hypothetical protein
MRAIAFDVTNRSQVPRQLVLVRICSSALTYSSVTTTLKVRQTKSPFEKAKHVVINLIERLRATPRESEGPHRMVLSAPNYRQVLLKDPEATLFDSAMSALRLAFAGSGDHVVLSDIEEELKSTVLRALSPQDDKLFRSQAVAAAEGLCNSLNEPPVEWDVFIPLSAPTVQRPTCFGRVTFMRSSCAEIRALLASRKGRGPERATKTLARAFESRTAARVTVLAKDGQAARVLGNREVRRTIDVLDYFGPTIDANYLSDLTSFEAVEVGATSSAIARSGNRLSWTGVTSFVRPLQLQGTGGYDRAQRAAHQLLNWDDLPKLKARVLNALMWAGRANVQRRQDQAFMMRMIALESALTGSHERAATTDRLRLRVVQVVGGTLEQRKKAYDLAGELYMVRSAIVHAGGSTGLTEQSAKSLKKLVERTLTALLTKRPFARMSDERAFDAWFQGQVLMGTRTGPHN